MNELSKLAQVLEHSIEKNGDKPITMKHLLNMIRMIQKHEDMKERMNWQGACEIDIY